MRAAVLLVTALVLATAGAGVATRIILQENDDDGDVGICDSFPEAAKGITTEAGLPLHLAKPPMLVTEEINNGMYQVTDGATQSVFLVGNNGIIVIDAPPFFAVNTTPTHVEAIKSVAELPVTHLVFSHFDRSHIGGAQAILDEWPNADVVSSPFTEQKIFRAKEVNPDDILVPPTLTFSEVATISLDGVIIIDDDASAAQNDTGNDDFEGLVMNIGDFHTGGDLIIYSPSRKILIAIDVVQPGWSPFQSLDNTINLHAFNQSHDTFLDFDFETFVGGHVNRLGTREDVEVQKEYLVDLSAAVTLALEQTLVTSLSPFNNTCEMYNMFISIPEFNAILTTKCANAMREKWVGRLGGFETFIRSNCLRVYDAHRDE